METHRDKFPFKEIDSFILLFIGFYLIVRGVNLLLKQTSGETSIDIDVFGGSFKINSPSAGLIVCFLGFVLIVLQFVII